MRGVAVAAVCLALLLGLHASLGQGAPLEGQLRLGRAAGDADNHYQRSTALYAAAYAAGAQQQQQQEQPVQEQPEAAAEQLSWWRWLWPWGRPEPRRAVAVLPYWADGRQASMVELELPQSHIDHELRPAPAPSAAAAAAAGGPGAGGDESAAAAVAALAGDLFNYNTSAMMPLVPWSWSWMTDAAQLRNRSNGFDIDVARRLSSYVAIAYCDPANLPAWNCSRCNGIAADFETHRVVFDVAWNLLAYVGVSRPLNAIVVSFRGTDSHSLYNWVENMRTWRTDMHINYPNAPAGALVHGGFFWSYNSSALAANVTQAVAELWAANKQLPVYVVGHSLGGALATICALDIRLNLGIEDVRLYSYGSPRVGNAVFAEWFREYVKVRWRFTHNRDMVPSVPIQLMGFRHVAQEVWLLELDKDHTLVGLCDESGEDPRCHNSMCYMGLCSSIVDHLLYLSEMYAPRPDGC